MRYLACAGWVYCPWDDEEDEDKTDEDSGCCNKEAEDGNNSDDDGEIVDDVPDSRCADLEAIESCRSIRHLSARLANESTRYSEQAR